MARHFDVADLESVADTIARAVLPHMKLASESLATEGPPAPPRRDEDVEAEDRANARRLLAAAPDLLKVSREMLDYLREHGSVRDTLGITTRAYTAIAKAEGKPTP